MSIIYLKSTHFHTFLKSITYWKGTKVIS